MVKISETEAKVNAPKRKIKLENIAVDKLRLVDAETGEDLSQQVIDAIPFDRIGFTITFEIEEASDTESVEN